MTLHFRCRICAEVLELGQRETCGSACAQALRVHRRPRRATRPPAHDFQDFVRSVRRGSTTRAVPTTDPAA